MPDENKGGLAPSRADADKSAREGSDPSVQNLLTPVHTQNAYQSGAVQSGPPAGGSTAQPRQAVAPAQAVAPPPPVVRQTQDEAFPVRTPRPQETALSAPAHSQEVQRAPVTVPNIEAVPLPPAAQGPASGAQAQQASAFNQAHLKQLVRQEVHDSLRSELAKQLEPAMKAVQSELSTSLSRETATLYGSVETLRGSKADASRVRDIGGSLQSVEERLMSLDDKVTEAALSHQEARRHVDEICETVASMEGEQIVVSRRSEELSQGLEAARSEVAVLRSFCEAAESDISRFQSVIAGMEERFNVFKSSLTELRGQIKESLELSREARQRVARHEAMLQDTASLRSVVNQQSEDLQYLVSRLEQAGYLRRTAKSQ